MVWRLLGFIIFVLGTSLIVSIIKDKKKFFLDKKYKAWIAISVIAVSCIALIMLTRSLDKKAFNSKRFNTIEEMAEICMPDETIDYVLYYENYAIVFLNNSNGEAMKWHPTNKDSEGWKGIDLNNINYKRLIQHIDEGDLEIITVDEKTGLDFIAYYYPNKKYVQGTENIISDTEGSAFKHLKLPSGYEMCYTFVDIDKPGYEITVDGETLKRDEIDFRFSVIYDYSMHKEKLEEANK